MACMTHKCPIKWHLEYWKHDLYQRSPLPPIIYKSGIIKGKVPLDKDLLIQLCHWHYDSDTQTESFLAPLSSQDWVPWPAQTLTSLTSQPLLRLCKQRERVWWMNPLPFIPLECTLRHVYLTAMRFAMIIISTLACYFLCNLDQQKKFKIAATEDTEDKQR